MGETEDRRPLEDVEVIVRASPKPGGDGANQAAAAKAEKTLKKRIEKAVADEREAGAEKQLDAADDEIDRARRSINANKVQKVKVRIRGRIPSAAPGSDDDEEVCRERSFKPKEGG